MAKIQDLRGKTMGGNSKRSTIKNIARHHSATDVGDVFSFQRHWKSLGWVTGGYHEVILRDGTVQLNYDSNVVTNGIYGHNNTTYHICLVGNGNFTAAQEKAFDERAKYNMERFNLSVNDVNGHNEFSGTNTACPGIDMKKVRARLKGSKVDAPKSKVKSETTTKGTIAYIQKTLNDRYGLKIAVDNIFGPETKKALVKGYQRELNKQFKRGLAVDGIWGPKTKRASVNIKRGAEGNLTWILQAILTCKRYDTLGVDGIFGKNTESAVRAFQRDNGLGVDGIAGPNTFEQLFS
ncbi:N-acetylmuramoyl-L-alanine amidase [Gracilibacillus thailandensis]|uniref:Autolysin n=1 Tax=Gracilibacillus thailandensis TaxID=563735 RepID=A0A6N7QVJ7_9BACI|nr:N-acetylmuramoyl-L-alanine amidase [Gracilibacillus thailandensis]MRI65172.1 hypothetical protein [Gracilibacillus thailandensis]